MYQDDVRKKINRIDYEIIKLLNDRMELALRTRKQKSKTKDRNREKAVFDNIGKYSHKLVHRDFSRNLFSEIMNESKRLQDQNLELIGFQGEHGANCEVASKTFNPDLVPIPCLEFADVFEGLENKNFDLGILPVENTLEGAVTEVNDLLINNKIDVRIVGEVKLAINHCLLTLPENDHREIKIVYSHSQALAQCRGFISRNNLEPRPFYDTAGAARMISNMRPKAAAAIASPAHWRHALLPRPRRDLPLSSRSRNRVPPMSWDRIS